MRAADSDRLYFDGTNAVLSSGCGMKGKEKNATTEIQISAGSLFIL